MPARTQRLRGRWEGVVADGEGWGWGVGGDAEPTAGVRARIVFG